MSVAADPVDILLADLGRLGVELLAEDERLRFRPRTAVDSQLQARLRRHKAKVIERLTEGDTADPPSPWGRKAAALLATILDDMRRVAMRDSFEERAAICEYEGGLPREEAERLAYEELRAAVGI